MRGRIEEKVQAIIAMENDVAATDVETTTMSLVSAVASSILTDDIETTVDLLVTLQEALVAESIGI